MASGSFTEQSKIELLYHSKPIVFNRLRKGLERCNLQVMSLHHSLWLPGGTLDPPSPRQPIGAWQPYTQPNIYQKPA